MSELPPKHDHDECHRILRAANATRANLLACALAMQTAHEALVEYRGTEPARRGDASMALAMQQAEQEIADALAKYGPKRGDDTEFARDEIGRYEWDGVSRIDDLVKYFNVDKISSEIEALRLRAAAGDAALTRCERALRELQRVTDGVAVVNWHRVNAMRVILTNALAPRDVERAARREAAREAVIREAKKFVERAGEIDESDPAYGFVVGALPLVKALGGLARAEGET